MTKTRLQLARPGPTKVYIACRGDICGRSWLCRELHRGARELEHARLLCTLSDSCWSRFGALFCLLQLECLSWFDTEHWVTRSGSGSPCWLLF